MKREDIDKRIDMPDVDAEWAQFEREVIGKEIKRKPWRVAAWVSGIGIAATIALLFMLNMGSEESADRPMIAQQVKEQPVVAQQPSGNASPVMREDSQAIMRLASKAQEGESVPNMQGRIVGLDVVPNSDILGGANNIRIAGSNSTHPIDSFTVILNGVILQDSIARRQAFYQAYIYKQHQIINSIKAYKDESSRARFETTYGFPPPRGGFIEIETIPDTLCDAYICQHPELKQTRRYIEGYVLGENDQPLADAWIGCGESTMGAATDSTGHFVMWAPRTITKLYVRHVGYQTIRHSIQPVDTVLSFRMKDATKIREVKVIPKNDRSKIQRIRIQ